MGCGSLVVKVLDFRLDGYEVESQVHKAADIGLCKLLCQMPEI